MDTSTLNKEPKWTVAYNIVSKESNRWVGTGWEFFDEESDANKCRDRHVSNGNCPTKRPYSLWGSDCVHLGGAHTEAYSIGIAKKNSLENL